MHHKEFIILQCFDSDQILGKNFLLRKQIGILGEKNIYLKVFL